MVIDDNTNDGEQNHLCQKESFFYSAFKSAGLFNTSSQQVRADLPSSGKMKTTAFYFRLVSLIPVLTLLFLSLLIVAAYIQKGHFPTYGNPDPKELTITYGLYFISEVLLILSFIAWPALAIMLFRDLRREMMYAFIYAIGLLALLLAFRMESWHLGEWIMD